MSGFLQDTNAWVALSFLIFAFILWRNGKVGFTAMLDKRIATVREEIQTAERLHAESRTLFADYEAKHKEAVTEADKIFTTAQRQVDELRARAEEDMRDSAVLHEKQLAERLERMTQNASDEIRQYIVDIAIKATEGIIADRLDQKAAESLLDKSIAGVASGLH